ncbi:MAG TPA: tRNA (N6-threonylcarbamoyladenosine(37)-N6)-methyltransferase TrmO, partial [Polyangiaceae bacterium]
YASKGATGSIELLPHHNFEHALSDIETWDHIWVIFWFHLNQGWRPKVLPPRSTRRRGVFATRSPHRPNPIGLSVLELTGVEGLSLKIRNLDLVDGTPILDIKPYVPFADSIPSASSGWVEAPDPEPGFEVVFDAPAKRQAAWLKRYQGVDLAPSITQTLSLGPAPHPYRRIRQEGAHYRLAIKDWRVFFRVEQRVVTVESIVTGYRPRQLAAPPTQGDDPSLATHRAFVAKFAPEPGER